MISLSHLFGLTGGIGSGKSTVAGFFSDLGARIIDADLAGHELLRRPGPVFNAVVQSFGTQILDSKGVIDRRKLAALAFTDQSKLRELNSIMHPAIRDRISQSAADLIRQNSRIVAIVEAALIFEAGLAFRKTIVAWCTPEQQMERLIEKKGFSRAEAEIRIASQMPSDEKRRRADFVVDCSGSLTETKDQVAAIYPKLQGLMYPPSYPGSDPQKTAVTKS